MRHKTIPAEVLPALLKALDDATDYRSEHHDGYCNNCNRDGALCGDHASDEQAAAEYSVLSAMLRSQGGLNDGFLGGLWAFLAPAGWATQWYWPAGVRGQVWNLLHGRGWQVR